jgi:hypothetical protein
VTSLVSKKNNLHTIQTLLQELNEIHEKVRFLALLQYSFHQIGFKGTLALDVFLSFQPI